MSIYQFITYCLRNGYITQDQYDGLLKRQSELTKKYGRQKNLYGFMLAELGWDKKKAIAVMKDVMECAEECVIPINQNANGSLEISKTKVILTDKPSSEPDNADATTLDSQSAYPKGKHFGKYIIVNKLGEGGMGAVYKVYHPGLKGYFALKVVLLGKVGKEGLLRFEREAKVSFKLKHPNIVQVHDVGVEGKNGHYILMDYIEGKDTGKLIKEKRFWPRSAFEIILPIARALQYSHEQGIIHRDIKPSNILVAGKDKPYLMDFGLASVVEEEGLTRSGQIMGTPQYMSPEQAKATKLLDGRSDIYSLGVVLYEMLSGKQMVDAGHVMAILYQVLHKDPPLLSKSVHGIAKDAEAIIMKCLEKDPVRRYQTAGDLADDIERYLRGEEIRAHSPGPLYRICRSIKRQWRITVLVGALVLAVTGVVISMIMISKKRAEAEKSQKKTAELQKKTAELQKKTAELQKKIYKINETWSMVNEQEKLQNFDMALALCKTLIEWDPTDKRFSQKVMDITEKKESIRKEARKHYDRAMEVFLNPRLKEEDVEICYKFFKNAIDEDQSFADAHFQAGRAAHRLFKIEEAIKHYEESLKHDPTLTPAKYYLTYLTLSVPDKNKTIEKKFNEIWSSEKTNDSKIEEDMYHLLARALLVIAQFPALWNDPDKKEKVWGECLEYCNKVINNYPNFSDAYFIRAQLYSYIMKLRENALHDTYITPDPKDLDKALKDCTKCIYLDPFRMEFYSLRGTIYNIIGAYELAEKDYTKTLSLKNVPKADFYRKRALCYLAMEKLNLALEDLNKNVELSKNNDYSRGNADAFVWRAILNACINNRKMAEDDLNNYISQSSVAGDIELFKTMVYLSIDEKTDRLETSFRNAIQTYGKNFKFAVPIIKSMSKKVSPDQFVQNTTLVLQNVYNLFCIPPELKQFKEWNSLIHNIIYSFESVIKGKEFDEYYSAKVHMRYRSVIIPSWLKVLNKSPQTKVKLDKINNIFQKECYPMTVEFILCFLSYNSEQVVIQNLFKIKDPPLSSLYYRRAIEYYINGNLEEARKDLESALDLEPSYMEVHYGLSTIYSILSRKDPSCREKAMYHLKCAVEMGWDHLHDYTLNDDDFKPLNLDKIPPDEIQSWENNRKENERQINELEKNIKKLTSEDNVIRALQLLYGRKPGFFYKLKDELNSTEEKVMEKFYKNIGKEGKKESDIDREIEYIFGERGRDAWESFKLRTK